ncbi:phosphatidylglycerol:prolipoprotein diacylglycerol transferase [Pilibacter termitis]|uniref:Phosphatidylglycerol--prolipoprotein diacylglyceryl transferase n=1 Tax=Pilibacter termitis TaxID=263852 RepID=A0A1T4MB47_9ENTE|nr:prolipoprotein diacylglyceryl transferase [Pilibacter termitis]SJZ64223.1 phosphatidylglycerol:prolipoprotein diacylglycerol transferase [Pilibacter termitis]
MFLAKIDPIAIRLFGLEIHWYAICVVLGMTIGVLIASKEAARLGWNSELVVDFMIYAMPLGIIGARIYYVLFQLPYYTSHPEEIFAFWNGGLAIYGGLITGLLVLYIFSKRHNFSIWAFLDIIAPSVMIGQAIGRWGNFFNQEAYGPTVSKEFLTSTLHLPNVIVDGMYIDGFYRQPTFLYESIWCFIGFFILQRLRQKRQFFKTGQVFLAYIIWYTFERMLVEGLRTDSLMILGVVRVSQALSILLFITAIALLIVRGKREGISYYGCKNTK